MPKLPNKIILFLFLVFNLSCSDSGERAIDTKEVAGELNDRTIKRVTEKQFKTWVDQKGLVITRLCLKELYHKLGRNKSVDENQSGADFHKLDIRNLTDSLEKTYHVKINKTGFNEKAPLFIQGDEEKKYFEDFKANRISLKSYVTSLPKEGKFLFVSPIIFDEKTEGMWSVLFTSKEVLKMITIKELKQMN